MDLRHHAGVNARAPELDPIARETRQPLLGFGARRPQQSNTIVAQVSFVVESPWISEVPRWMQFRADPKPRAVSKGRRRHTADRAGVSPSRNCHQIGTISGRMLHTGPFRRIHPIVDRQPHAHAYWLAGRTMFDCLRFNIDGLANRMRTGRTRIALANDMPG